MYVIGLTGMIASGKSTVSAFLRQRGIEILDADQISHQVILRGGTAFCEIVARFGEGCVGSDGQIDRRKLGEIVFADREKLEMLNGIVHPEVIREIKSGLARAEGIVVIDAPLLVQAGLDRLCDEIWYVCADRDLRIRRIMDRDHLEEAQALARVQSQQESLPADRPVCRIDNSGSYDALTAQVLCHLARIETHE